MNLLETDAKAILRDAGLATPGGARLIGDGEIASVTRPVVIKAQILRGGRGKAGLVKAADQGDAANRISEIVEALKAAGEEPLVLVEDQIAFSAEYYVAWRIDDLSQRPVLMFSLHGGIEVEENPQALRQFPVSPLRPLQPYELIPFLRDAGLGGRTLGSVARFAAELYRVFRAEDAVLLEVNPLAVTAQGQAVALDCKMTVDECAATRHPQWANTVSRRLRHASMTPLEAKGSDRGLTFVELKGDVAIVSSGAGLGMTLVDLLVENGHRAANFCDLPGGSSQDMFSAMVDLVFDRAEQSDVKAIISFFTLSATPLKSAVVSLLEAIERRPPKKPLVLGFAASGSAERDMSSAEATAAFAERGYRCVADLADLMSSLDEALITTDGGKRA